MKTNTFVRGLTAAFLVTTLCLGLTARAQAPAPVSNASNGDLYGQEGFVARRDPRKALPATTVVVSNVTVQVFTAKLPNTSHPSYATSASAIRDWLMAGAPTNSKPSAIIDRLAIENLLAAGNSDQGTRTHFPLLVESKKKFTLSGVSWVMSSSDSANSLGYSSSLSGLSFDPVTRVGVDYGADNMPGGAQDTTRTTDGGSVNKLVYIGAGNSYRANSQVDIDGATAYFNAQRPFVITCIYRLQFEDGGILTVSHSEGSFGAVTLTSTDLGSNFKLQLGVSGDVTGANFTIQSSHDLKNWVNTSTSLAPGGSTTIPKGEHMFFRAYRP